ncbi:UNKNOWN [Stylonychia lemnae]|uniref:Uncharacterized protein n=1 Tax=Stylonychia lemnae TaxID=5949 RepID=A0A078AVY1_STYLE|nr:UNKNOWN [Stylonychia lemnae]|eukprot:CDW84933.1 UNKNOWN [Stylonychia lemnae]
MQGRQFQLGGSHTQQQVQPDACSIKFSHLHDNDSENQTTMLDYYRHDINSQNDFHMLDDHTNIFINQDDLCRAFQDTDNFQSAEDLLTTLTVKFNRLLETLKNEELEKRKYQKQVIELQTQINSYNEFKDVLDRVDLLRDNQNLKGKIMSLESELKIVTYEKTKLEQVFEEMKKKIEERVPVINELLNSEKNCKELEQQLRGHTERLNSLRKLNQQYESKIKQLQDEFDRVLGNDSGVRDLKDKCIQLEMDNRELTRHIKILIETQSENQNIDLFKQKIQVLENKIHQMAQQNIDLIQKCTRLEEDKFLNKERLQQQQELKNIGGQSKIQNQNKNPNTICAPLQMVQQKPKVLNTTNITHQSDLSNPMKSYNSINLSNQNIKFNNNNQILSSNNANQSRMNITELRNINISDCDLRMSMDEQQIEREIKAITERSAQLEASHQQTFGGDDLFYKLNRSEIKQHEIAKSSSHQILNDKNNYRGMDEDDEDDIDDVLSLQPEKLDIQSLSMSN